MLATVAPLLAMLQTGQPAAPSQIPVAPAICNLDEKHPETAPKWQRRSEMTQAESSCYAAIEKATSNALSSALLAVRATPSDAGWRTRLHDINAAHCAMAVQDASQAGFDAGATRFALPTLAVLRQINTQLTLAAMAEARKQPAMQINAALAAAGAFQMRFKLDHFAWERCMAAALK